MKGCKDENEHKICVFIDILVTTGSDQYATVNHLKAEYFLIVPNSKHHILKHISDRNNFFRYLSTCLDFS